MRSLIPVLISAILAAVAAWTGQQIVLATDPTASDMVLDCTGAGVFAVFLLWCLVSLELQSGRAEH